MKTITSFLSDSEISVSTRLGGPSNKPATVLVVEDDEMVCALVREILISDGFTVLACHNGVEALDIVASYCGALELLVTDIVLPGIGGKQLVEGAIALRPGLKTLFMSGYPEDTLISFGWPSLPYIQKPFTAKGLTRRVRQALSVGPRASDVPPVINRPSGDQ